MRRGLRHLDQIVVYIKKNLKKGYSKDSLKWALVNQGLSRVEIEKAFLKVNEDFTKESTILKDIPKITNESVMPKLEPVNEKKSFWKELWGG